MSFGKVIAEARKKKMLSQKELALKITKAEDGKPISAQYLNDIEHERRNPDSDHLIEQFARVLNIDADVLYFHARKIPHDMLKTIASEKDVKAAFQAFRKKIKG
ncbi:MAG: XRE family transcriptional regulator [Deltaproteobacteria bacterium RIFCSPLOWO2_02_FULL_44_10]|nr:MAG: XRE family transcriptional regulator [Deltaproteobacteria bacterium RIFCSPHIGHO2_02_FULL_44_16]OGQ45778.1 MAG: XRE family transcriptional regulator [Deltaproteobacteria bacterium RIFCSPLOWO2_02_FULL_44_10]